MNTNSEQNPESNDIQLENNFADWNMRQSYIEVDPFRLQSYIYGMETRIKTIESQIYTVKNEIQEVKSEVKSIRKDIIDGQNDSNKNAQSIRYWIVRTMLAGMSLTVGIIALQNSWYQQTLDRNWETANKALDRIDSLQRQGDLNKYEIQRLDREKAPAFEVKRLRDLTDSGHDSPTPSLNSSN